MKTLSVPKAVITLEPTSVFVTSLHSLANIGSEVILVPWQQKSSFKEDERENKAARKK